MSRRNPLALVAAAAVIPLTALAIAGCGDDNDNSSAAAPPKTSSGHAAAIGVESNGSLGKILVDSKGRTIYLFEKDSGPKSTCFGACAAAWPPVTASGMPAVGSGLTASKVGTTRRSDGKAQVTYSGHPLYLYEADQNPGDVNGQGLNAFGAAWYVLSPTGNEVTSQSSSSAGGGGYGY